MCFRVGGGFLEGVPGGGVVSRSRIFTKTKKQKYSLGRKNESFHYAEKYLAYLLYDLGRFAPFAK